MTLMERDRQKKRMRVAPSQVEKEEKEDAWAWVWASTGESRPLIGDLERSSGRPGYLTLPLLLLLLLVWLTFLFRLLCLEPVSLRCRGSILVLFVIPKGGRVNPDSPPQISSQKALCDARGAGLKWGPPAQRAGSYLLEGVGERLVAVKIIMENICERQRIRG